MDMFGEAGKVHRGLAGGISPSDDADFFVTAHLSFHLGRAIVDARAFELREVRQIQFSIFGASRYNDAASSNGSSIVQLERVWRLGVLERNGSTSHRDMRPELFRLHERAPGERLPRNTHRE